MQHIHRLQGPNHYLELDDLPFVGPSTKFVSNQSLVANIFETGPFPAFMRYSFFEHGQGPYPEATFTIER